MDLDRYKPRTHLKLVDFADHHIGMINADDLLALCETRGVVKMHLSGLAKIETYHLFRDNEGNISDESLEEVERDLEDNERFVPLSQVGINDIRSNGKFVFEKYHFETDSTGSTYHIADEESGFEPKQTEITKDNLFILVEDAKAIQKELKRDFIGLTAAMEILEGKWQTTVEELAAWIFIESGNGGIDAYVNANEFSPPPKFSGSSAESVGTLGYWQVTNSMI